MIPSSSAHRRHGDQGVRLRHLSQQGGQSGPSSSQRERKTDSHAFPSCVPSSQVKKRQQRALFILDSLKVAYEAIDITEPANQEENERFRSVCKRSPGDKLPLPPQFFNDDTYCGVSTPASSLSRP